MIGGTDEERGSRRRERGVISERERGIEIGGASNSVSEGSKGIKSRQSGSSSLLVSQRDKLACTYPKCTVIDIHPTHGVPDT